MDKTIRRSLIISLVWSVGLLLVGLLGFKGQVNLINALSNWDGQHFLGIAQNGYASKLQYAFFPLYPLLIHEVATLSGLLYPTAALFLNLIIFVIIIIVFTKLIKLDFSNLETKKILVLFLLFPTSFFLITIYSEGLFLLLTLLTFYLMRKQQFVWATLFAGLAATTRLVGLATIVALWSEVYLTLTFRKNWLVFLAPIGFLIYCYFLQTQTGDPFYFLVAEQNWQRIFSLPGVSIWQTINQLLTFGLSVDNSSRVLINLIFTIFGLGLALRSFRILRGSYAIYGLLVLLIPALSNSLVSMPRFVLVAFPVFITLAKFKIHWLEVYSYFSILLLSYFLMEFINGFFIS